MMVVDGRQTYEHPRIDQEIFAKLHRNSVVLADITGMRPNCFLELGYALGRGLPTMLMVKDGKPPSLRHLYIRGPALEDDRVAGRATWSVP